MPTVNLIKAAARSQGGKVTARAERRAGRVPGIIYGDGKEPLPISLDYVELRQRIYAGLDENLVGLDRRCDPWAGRLGQTRGERVGPLGQAQP